MGEKLVQGNQQLDFVIKLSILKSANPELEIGAISLLYFLHTLIHPGKQKPSILQSMRQTECCGVL